MARFLQITAIAALGLLLSERAGASGVGEEKGARPERTAMDALIAAVADEGLPAQLLELKRSEGELKAVPEALLLEVLQALAGELRAAAALLPGSRRAPEDAPVITAAALALHAGAGPAELAQLLGEDHEPEVTALALQAVTSLLGFQVPSADAVALVRAALEGDQVERLLTLRPAVELLVQAGLTRPAAAAALGGPVSRGTSPVAAARELLRTLPPPSGDPAPAAERSGAAKVDPARAPPREGRGPPRRRGGPG